MSQGIGRLAAGAVTVVADMVVSIRAFPLFFESRKRSNSFSSRNSRTQNRFTLLLELLQGHGTYARPSMNESEFN